MAIPAFVSASAKAAAAQDATPALPASMAAGAIVILCAVCPVANTISISAVGSIATWTAISGSPVTVTAGMALYAWWGRWASGTTGPTVHASASDSICAATAAWSGCLDVGSPIDIAATGTEATSDTSFSFATGTSSTRNNTLAICVASILRDSNTASVPVMTNASLGSLASRLDFCTNTGSGGGFGLSEGTKATAGTLGTWACTFGASSPKGYLTFALIGGKSGAVATSLTVTQSVAGTVLSSNNWNIVQSTKKNVNGVSSSTKAFTSNVAAGHLLLVGQFVYDPAGPSGTVISTPTDTLGSVYIPINGEIRFNTGLANTLHLNLFLALAPSSGANTVTFGQTAATGVFATVLLAEISGNNGIFPGHGANATVNNSGSTAADSGNVLVEKGALLLGLCGTASGANPATLTEGTDYTSVQKETDGVSNIVVGLEYRETAVRANVSASYTIDSNKWGVILVALVADSDAVAWTAPTLSTAATNGTQSAAGFADIRPNAQYDAVAGSGGKTILPYVGGAASNLCVATFDHATQVWDSPQIDIDTGGVADGHDAPSFIIGADGKYHLFWGCHITPLQYVRSANAHDPTAWSVQSDVVASASYPNAWLASNGRIVVFHRAGGHTADWQYVVSTDNGATWGSATTIFDSTAANVFYLSAKQVGDVVHMVMTWEDEGGSLGTTYPLYTRRYGLYYLKITTLTGTLAAVANDGAALSFPITKADLDAHCVIRAKADPLLDIEPRLMLDLSGNPALLVVRGAGLNHTVSLLRYNGSSWVGPYTICETGVEHVNDVGMVVNTAANTWTAWVIRNGSSQVVGDADATSNPVDQGGNLDQYDSTDDGVTWTRQGVVSARARLNWPGDVENGIAPVKYFVADYVDTGTAGGHILAWAEPAVAGGRTTKSTRAFPLGTEIGMNWRGAA